MLIARPENRTKIQLAKQKTNPVEMSGVRLTYRISDFLIFISKPKPVPKPIRMLNNGPAKHAVIAMFARPFRAIVTFADRSAIELPQARIVRPMILFGMRSVTPRNSSRATSLSATASIHVAAMTNP